MLLLCSFPKVLSLSVYISTFFCSDSGSVWCINRVYLEFEKLFCWIQEKILQFRKKQKLTTMLSSPVLVAAKKLASWKSQKNKHSFSCVLWDSLFVYQMNSYVTQREALYKRIVLAGFSLSVHLHHSNLQFKHVQHYIYSLITQTEEWVQRKPNFTSLINPNSLWKIVPNVVLFMIHVFRVFPWIFMDFSIGLQSDSKITDFLRLDQTSSIKQQSSKEPLIKRFHRQNDQKSKVLSILQSQVRGRFPSTWSWQHYLASFQVVLVMWEEYISTNWYSPFIIFFSSDRIH